MDAAIVQERLEGYLGAPVSGVREISDGWETEVCAFNTGRAGAAQELVLRVYPGENTESRASLEFHVMKQLRASGYPVPEVISLELERSRFGGPFLIMERIRGGTLGRQYLDAEAQGRRAVMAQFARLWARLHGLDTAPFVGPGAVWPTAEAAGGIHQPAFILDMVRRSPAGEALEPLVARVEEWGKSVAWRPAALVHGDFHMWNILMRQDGAPAVIDWSWAGLSDPRFDLAWSVVLAKTDGSPDFGRAMREAYEAEAGAPAADFDYFEAFALVRRLGSVLIALTSGGAVLGLRPGLEAMLRQRLADVHGLYRYVEAQTVPLPLVEQVLARLA